MDEIELHIEELILYGFKHADRQRIAEAVQEELTRLLKENKLPEIFERHGEHPHIHGGPLVIHTGERPEATGGGIGQALYQGIAGNSKKENRE